jgi:pilus assembly protein CpaB
MQLPRLKLSPVALLIGLALLLGIGTSWLVVHTLKQREAQAEAALQAKMHVNQVDVVVPTRDLKAGITADSTNMAERSIPEDLVYPDTITADDWSDYQGRVLTRPVYRGKPMQSDDFAPAQAASFAANLNPGERAMTVDVSGANSLAGLLQPGNRIDLMLLTKGIGGSQEIPLLRHIRILATGRTTQALAQNPAQPDEGGSTYGSITIAVTPPQAARLALAEQVGTFRVALMPAAQPVDGPLPPLVKAELFGVVPSGHGTRLIAIPPPTVQYIIGSAGENSVSQLPAGALSTPPSAPPASPQAAMAAASTKELQALQKLLQQTKTSTASLHSAPEQTAP